jgi:hypothetical protein
MIERREKCRSSSKQGKEDDDHNRCIGDGIGLKAT